MNDSKSVLILGGSVMQLPSIRIARRKGWTVIAADVDTSVPGRAEADVFFNIDLKDKEGMETAARRYKEANGLDGVFTAATDFSATVAWVAEKLTLPGIPYQTALNASNKGRMRDVFRKAGIPSPGYTVLKRGDDPGSVLDLLSLPLVIKPVDNMGARGIRRIDGADDFVSAVPAALAYSVSSTIIIEEYVEGPEFSIDAIVENGNIEICGFADRHICFPPYFVEMGHTIPSSVSSAVRDVIVSVFKSAVEALGIHTGAAKGDVKLSPAGPVIGEIAARLSGGYMSGWTFPYSSGVSVTEAALNLSVGLPAGDLTPLWKRTSAERAFISIPGVVGRIERGPKGENLPGIKELFLHTSVGEAVGFPTNNVEKCGNFIAVDAERERAVFAAEDACRKILLRLKPGDLTTSEFLFGAESWVPNAFSLCVDENIAEIEAMPLIVPDGNNGDRRGIAVVRLPGLFKENSRDWQGNSIIDAFNTVYKKGRCSESGRIVLGGIFWRAFLRGGIQGGLWLIDTVCYFLKKGKPIEEIIDSWTG